MSTVAKEIVRFVVALKKKKKKRRFQKEKMALIPVSAEIQRKPKLHPQKVGWELATGDSGLGDSFLLTLAQT